MKIARSGDLGITATHKCNESFKIVEKLATCTLCFKSFGKAHECSKYCVLLATPINCAVDKHDVGDGFLHTIKMLVSSTVCSFLLKLSYSSPVYTVTCIHIMFMVMQLPTSIPIDSYHHFVSNNLDEIAQHLEQDCSTISSWCVHTCNRKKLAIWFQI